MSIARAGTTPRSQSPHAKPSSRIPLSWVTQELSARVKIWTTRRDGKATSARAAEAACDRTDMRCHKYIRMSLWVSVSARAPGVPLLR